MLRFWSQMNYTATTMFLASNELYCHYRVFSLK